MYLRTMALAKLKFLQYDTFPRVAIAPNHLPHPSRPNELDVGVAIRYTRPFYPHSPQRTQPDLPLGGAPIEHNLGRLCTLEAARRLPTAIATALKGLYVSGGSQPAPGG